MKIGRILILTGVIACCVACTGDFAVTFVFGSFYPGYSQMRDTMSALGASASPVSDVVSAWWVLMGVLFMVFAVAFNHAYKPRRYARTAALLLLFYGLGEGFGSGLFKADTGANGAITSYLIHNILGGVGVVAVMAFPLVMRRIIPREEDRMFYHLSCLVFILAVVFIALFLFRFTATGMLAELKGLWQRLFVANIYLYLLVIAVRIFKGIKPRT